MAVPNKQTKRSSMNFEEKAVIKRQFSERTLVANELEKYLHLGNADQVPSLSPKFERAQTIDSDNSFFLDSRVFEKNSSTKESKPDIERERSSEPEQEDHCLSEDLGNTDVSFSHVQVVDVPIIPENTQTTEAEEGVEEEGCDEPDGLGKLLGKIGHKITQVVDRVMPHQHHHHDEKYYGLEGFNVHLPARFHQFDTPCPFGARLNKSEEGYKLAEVLVDTAAYKAGLRESDTLTHLNDRELHTLDISEIMELFMDIEITFTLTILRKYGEGDKVHLEKTTIRVTIDDGVLVEIVNTEIVCSQRPYKVSTSALSFICQDEDDVPQIYLNTSGEIVTMGKYIDQRAHFYLDFYVVIGHQSQGQLCAIRHANTSTLYDAVQNNMKPLKDPYNPDLACMLDKIARSDGTFVFESVERQGHYLVYERTTGTLKLSQCVSLSSVPSSGSFDVTGVKSSRV
eukprot:XP_800233.1 PREDICTED: uncharacterized protein LOC583539 [Strongylocentrotus purpuratus]